MLPCVRVGVQREYLSGKSIAVGEPVQVVRSYSRCSRRGQVQGRSDPSIFFLSFGGKMGAPDVRLVAVGPEAAEEPLYDPALLAALDWRGVTYMKGGVTSASPGPGLRVRPLCKADYDRGFLQLLAQLTKVGETSRQQFEERFEAMRRCTGHYYVTVVEDMDQGRVVASATLACEMKFIRGCAMRGRLEDVVVSDQYRGRQLGKLIVATINLLAQQVGCYKLGLDCKDEMKPFYSSLGYTSEAGNDNTMIIRFPSPPAGSCSTDSPPHPTTASSSRL